MAGIAYVNGEFVPLEEAKVSIHDRALAFGDGIYEVVRFVQGYPFNLERHLDRLERSAQLIRIRLPWSRDELRSLLFTAIDRSGVSEGLVYLQVSRGIALRSHGFAPDLEPSVIMTVRPYAGWPAHFKEEGISVVTRPDPRWAMCRIKSLNLLPNVLTYQEAVDQGHQEAVFVGADGLINEGTQSNFWAVLDGVLRTAGKDRNILWGTTREVVLELAADQGIPVEEKPVSVEDLSRISEAFMTNCGIAVMPVTRIDGRPVADGKPGPVTRRLLDAYERRLQEEVSAGRRARSAVLPPEGAGGARVGRCC